MFEGKFSTGKEGVDNQVIACLDVEDYARAGKSGVGDGGEVSTSLRVETRFGAVTFLVTFSASEHTKLGKAALDRLGALKRHLVICIGFPRKSGSYVAMHWRIS